MFQCLKDLNNSLNQYFPNDQWMMLQNNAQLKDPFRVQDRPMDFSVTEYEMLIYNILDSTLQVVFKKLPLNQFWCDSKEKYPNYL